MGGLNLIPENADRNATRKNSKKAQINAKKTQTDYPPKTNMRFMANFLET